jgi:hypothetical protein
MTVTGAINLVIFVWDVAQMPFSVDHLPEFLQYQA